MTEGDRFLLFCGIEMQSVAFLLWGGVLHRLIMLLDEYEVEV